MTSEEQNNDDESVKGFAGLSSMVSDVDDTVKDEKPKRQNTSPRVAPIERSIPPQPERQTKQSPEPYQKPIQQPSDDPSFVKWWIGVGVVIFLIWVSIDNENKNIVPSSTTPTQPTYVQQTTPPSISSGEYITNRANDLYKQGRYVEAFPLVEQMAKRNYPNWQRHLGFMFANGQGVALDYNQAVYWYRKAAEQGDAVARVELSKLINSQTPVKIEAEAKAEAKAKAKAKTQARLEAQAQVQARIEAQTQARIEAQTQARLEAQTQALDKALAQTKAALAQTQAAQAKAATDKLGVTLPDGGIVFYVDSSGSHGLEAKATDEPNLLDWVDAIDAVKGYGSGWRLPTSGELQLLYEEKAVVGGFATGNYWSSTKSANRTVWRQSFYDGVTRYQPMDDELRVRAVRAF